MATLHSYATGRTHTSSVTRAPHHAACPGCRRRTEGCTEISCRGYDGD